MNNKKASKATLKGMLYASMFFMMMQGCEKTEDFNPRSLTSLPADTGGTHLPVYPLDIQNYAHYLYLPSSYNQTEAEYPLIVFLHGAGERGNSFKNKDHLKKVLKYGPPMLIERKKWNPSYPFIVVSPQCHTQWWDPAMLRDMISNLKQSYRINPERIYLTGVSMGGFGTFAYLQQYGDSAGIAAAVPICGGGNSSKAETLAGKPVWAFHGDTDNIVPSKYSVEMIESINALKPEIPARLTIFPGVGHNSWDLVYDESGMGKEDAAYDRFDMSIYDWMLIYTHTSSRK